MFSSGLIWGVSWFWYLSGFLGIGATVAVFYLAPTAAIPILIRVFKFLIGTRIGVGLLVGCVVFMVADIRRSRMDTADFNARTAAFEQAQRDRDKRIAQETRELVWKEIADATAENVIIDKDVKEFHDALPPITGVNPYRIGNDACRLRHLAGQAGCGPKGTQGVPTPRQRRPGP